MFLRTVDYIWELQSQLLSLWEDGGGTIPRPRHPDRKDYFSLLYFTYLCGSNSCWRQRAAICYIMLPLKI